MPNSASHQNCKTVIAFDFGLKNIGMAIGQAVTRTASPLTPLKAKNGVPDWRQLQHVLNEGHPDVLVIGLPLNMDGTESELSLQARKFASQLQGRFNFSIEFADERLTSREAKAMAREKGHKGDFAGDPVDSIAAVLILESWWRS